MSAPALVKRHLEGEPARALAKEYKISTATMYNWIANYRMSAVEAAKKAGLSKSTVESAERLSLKIENGNLKIEVRKLREALVALMVKHGEI